jgi:multiple sugar transport system substrate-binding protein
MLKRHVPFVSSCVLVFAATACGSSDEKSSSASSVADLSYMAWYNIPSEIKTTQGTLDAFNSSQEHVHMDLVSADRKVYEDKLNARSDSNTLPDTAMMTESQVISWALAGKLADVSDLYQDEKPLPQLAFTYQGRTVAYSEANEVIIIIYSRKAFDDANLPYPPAKAENAWTWDEFVSVAKKLTKDQKGLTPNDAGFDADHIVTYGGDFNRRSWIWPVMAESNGGGVVSADGKTLLLESQETAEAAQAVADLQHVHHVSESYSDWSKDMGTLDQQLLSGKFAMVVSGQWELGITLVQALAAHPNFYGVGVLPKMKTAITYNTGGVNVMFNTTKKPAAAREFIKWYSLEENNLANIQSGLWMPILKKWYTDETLIRTWVDNSAHPPLEEYRSAVIDYALNNAKQVPWYYVPAYDKIDAIVASGMESVWDGTKTAAQVLRDDIVPQVQPIFEANQR